MNAQALTAYDELAAKIDEVKEQVNFIPDVSTDEGYTKSKRVSLDIGRICTAVEGKRKELKAESLEYGRKVDSHAKAIVDELKALQLPHQSAYKELDNLKKQRENDRKAGLEERVNNLRNLPELLRDSDSESIKAAMEDLANNECLDFYEYATPALQARNKSREELAGMFARALKREQEAAELAELRKKQVEQDQKERDERIAKEAADKARAEEAEATRKAEAAMEAEKAAKLAAEKAAKEAAKQAELAAKAAAKKAAQDKKDAIEKAKKEAKEKADKVEQDRLAALQAERDAEEKRQANKRHCAKINNAAATELVTTAEITSEQAKAVVTAIAKGLIPSINISY